MNKITIGIPAYNEIRFIERTLASVVNQADEIIISDNASSDGTTEVCQRFANQYPNIRFIHQEENIGASRNFWYVFEQAHNDFFMWMGGHDIIPDGYTNELLNAMAISNNIALAYAPSHHLRPDYSTEKIQYFDDIGDVSINSPDERVLRIASCMNDCGILQGVFRRDALNKAIKSHDELLPFNNNFFSDHLLLSEIARLGRMVKVTSTGFGRMNNHDDFTGDTMQKAFSYMQLIAQKLHPDKKPEELNIAEFRIGSVAGQYLSAIKMLANGETKDPYFPNKVLVGGVQHLLSWLYPISDANLDIKPSFEKYVYDTIFTANYLVQYRNIILQSAHH